MKKNYKKIISFLLVLTISFCSISNYKQKDVKAFDFVVTPTILWTLGSLVTATGIIALNHEQITDMGQMVLDKVGDVKQFIFEETILLSGKLIQAILETSNELPTVNKTIPKILSEGENFVSGELNISNMATVSFDSSVLSNYFNNIPYLQQVTINNTTTENVSVAFYSSDSSNGMSVTIQPGEIVTVNVINHYNELGGTYQYGVGLAWYNETTGRYSGKTYGRTSTNNFPLTYSFHFPSELVTNSSLKIEIPYSNPKVRENYFPDTLPNNIPTDEEEQGRVKIPTGIPDIPISGDNPLDWDRAKDELGFDVIPVEDTGTDTDVGELDDTWTDNGNEEEQPEEQKGLWGWLSRFLLRFVNGLKAIWSTLQNILNYFKTLNDKLINSFKTMLEVLFKNFVKELISPLIQGFKDLLSELFKPNLSFNDMFNPIGDNGFSDLGNIMDWSALFDIAPQPFRFSTTLGFDMIVRKETEDLTINIDELPFLKDNITFIRNLLSFPLLMGSFWFVIHHFLPKREID